MLKLPAPACLDDRRPDRLIGRDFNRYAKMSGRKPVIDAEWESVETAPKQTNDDALVTLICFFMIMAPICWGIFTLCKNGSI